MSTKVDAIKRMIEFQKENGNSLLADILETELQYQLELTPKVWIATDDNDFVISEEEEVN
jgi:hypothetical protein